MRRFPALSQHEQFEHNLTAKGQIVPNNLNKTYKPKSAPISQLFIIIDPSILDSF